MGRRRKLFTKREYERLSKTSEGRQKICKTYINSSIAALLVSIGMIISLCALEFKYHFDGIVMGMGLVIGIPGFLISVYCIIHYSSALKQEQEEEILRIQEEEKQRRLAEQRAIDAANQRAQEERERIARLKASNINTVDAMSGRDFEDYIAGILEDLGYHSKKTKTTGDFGADLIIEKPDEKIIVQLKRYTKKVSVSAVQEISTAKSYYGINQAWVITNNYFTHPAQELAQANNIRLIDRDELIGMILQSKSHRKE